MNQQAATSSLKLSLCAAFLGLLLAACSSDDGEPSATGGASGTATGGGTNSGGTNSGGGGTGASATGGGAGTGGSVDPADVAGVFSVNLVAEATVDGTVNPAHTLVRGSVANGPAVPDRIWNMTLESGGCKLLEPYIPFCEQDCGTNGVCVADDVCRVRPTNLDLGSVTLSGVSTTGGGTEVELMAVQGVYQVPGSVTLAYPPAGEGSTITVASDGVAIAPSLTLLEAFSIQSRGIAPLEIASGETVPMDRDQAVNISWTPPADPSQSRVFAEVDISHHGGQKGQIDCEVDDNGSLTIAAELITALINLGVAGYPDIRVSRRATGSATTSAGPVELRVISQATLAVSIPWLQSCTPTAEDPTGGCPAGQTCGDTMMCE